MKLRVLLVVIGVGIAGFGLLELVTNQRLDQLLSVLIWLAAAILVHDLVIAPLLSLRRRRRNGRVSS